MTYHQIDEKGAVIPYPGEVPAEAVAAIERADDEQIVRSFTGGFAQENLLYSYEIKTKTGKVLVVGVGVDGAKEIARLLGNVEVQPDAKVQEKDDYFYGMIRARDLLRNVTLAGFARQCKYYLDEANRPTERLNEWAYVIALTKAQRNAILAITPQGPLIKIVQEFISQKKATRLTPPRQTITKQPEAKPEVKPGAKKEPGKLEMNKLKAAFMMSWREYEGLMVWGPEESDKQRASWLKEKFGKDSLTELTAEELGKAKSMVDGDITAIIASTEERTPQAEPAKAEAKAEEELASLAERQQVAEQIMSRLKVEKNEVKDIVVQVTGKKRDWTRQDIKKILDYIEEEEQKLTTGAEAEADSFLSENLI